MPTSVRSSPPASCGACTANTGRMKNRPEHAQAEDAGEATRRRAVRSRAHAFGLHRQGGVKDGWKGRRRCAIVASFLLGIDRPIHGTSIRIRGARTHNLKNLNLELPRNRLVVITGPVRLGQVLARLRHALRRRPAPLRRVALGLRAPVPAADGEARRRPDRGPVAGDRHRAEGGEPQPALHRRHRHRDPRLPAPALRARRHALLPGPRPAARSADGGADGGPRRSRCPRTRG